MKDIGKPYAGKSHVRFDGGGSCVNAMYIVVYAALYSIYISQISMFGGQCKNYTVYIGLIPVKMCVTIYRLAI